MSKNKKIGIKAIKKELSNCAFNPNELGPLKIIFDNHNIEYYLPRARELLLDAENNPDLFDQRVTMAIKLLIFSKLKKKENDDVRKDERMVE